MGELSRRAVTGDVPTAAARELGTGEREGADKNSPMEDIFERSIFDGIFVCRTSRSGFMNSVGRFMPYTPNKP